MTTSTLFAPGAGSSPRHGHEQPTHEVVVLDARTGAEDDGVEEVCIIGGTALFEAALPRAKRLYITEVEASPEGDAVFPSFDETAWVEVSSESQPAGEKDNHAFTFRVLERR